MLTVEHKAKIKYLNQLKFIDCEIDRKIEEMDKWRSRATSITSITSDMPRGGGVNDKIGECIANLTDLNVEVNNSIDLLCDLKREIEGKINKINDDRLKNILIDRYIYYKTWEEIAYKNHYSWQWVYKLHEKALDLI